MLYCSDLTVKKENIGIQIQFDGNYFIQNFSTRKQKKHSKHNLFLNKNFILIEAKKKTKKLILFYLNF